NVAAAEELAREIGGVAVECDVGSSDSAEAALAQAAAAHGPARLLVNCAGVGTPAQAVGKDGPRALAAYEKVIRVNLIGTFNMIRLAAAAMQKL
ncbi:SDR family oxidoreductase, partial [Acinetobacter baumannii]